MKISEIKKRQQQPEDNQKQIQKFNFEQQQR